ncbi:hypothetical protein PGQ11_002018 [Apiospora arundinis]|uniref:Uncharacterized protein n=1 Tax=Apiospora arundinis TaxID=335852 RepID=A0ABR2JI68_9PEZI
MDILREYASLEYDKAGAEKFTERDHPLELHIYSAVDAIGQDFVAECELSTDALLFDALEDKRERRRANQKASLELIFLPIPLSGKGFGLSRHHFKRLYRDLGLDDSLLGFLISSRSGWYCVDNGNGCHSFLYKDYLYSLAWSFNAKTMETRAMICERSAYGKHSSLKKERNNSKIFDLPGIKAPHLYHPLTLALFGLIDARTYLDGIIVTDGYRLGEVEKLTNHGAWAAMQKNLEELAKKKALEKRKTDNSSDEKTKPEEQDESQESNPPNVNALSSALRKIAEVIGVFSNFFKSVDVATSMAKTLEDSPRWEAWLEKWLKKTVDEERKKDVLLQFETVARSMPDAVRLLCDRIHTVDQTAKATQKRAKAQANVVSGLIAREDTRFSHHLADRARRDGSTMKVIALMTMGFLPATFYAALWSIPVLEEPGLTKDDFWVYWAFTVPTTIVIFLVWDWLNDNNLRKLTSIETYRTLLKRAREVHGAKLTNNADSEKHLDMRRQESPMHEDWGSPPRNRADADPERGGG